MVASGRVDMVGTESAGRGGVRVLRWTGTAGASSISGMIRLTAARRAGSACANIT